ncbi:class I SAM-dependent methyltransferase [Streptomyces sp. NPDC050504]|uniref:class I SAM-dependent methyltransferase n=1 Tax=Streptomyces sp. NPDC050504 TaxID=3365618 RepID=UPI0037A7B5A0
MADSAFADETLAALYDPGHPSELRADFAFYRPLIMAAPAVLDVGCGTGSLLHSARDAGHTGRLCGLDPAPGMLKVARARVPHGSVEWTLGDLSSVSYDREFDLVVMAGHAFQVFVTDTELRTALAKIAAALADGGRFAFETRNPSARAWEGWTVRDPVKVTGPDGEEVAVTREVEEPAPGARTVSFTTRYDAPSWPRPRSSRSTLRFLDSEALAGFLDGAGLKVVEQYGDWDRSPLTPASPEIVTVAGRA